MQSTRYLTAAVAAISLSMAACEDGLAPELLVPGSASHAVTAADVSLRVRFDEPTVVIQGAELFAKAYSDGGGAYVDGQDRVYAKLEEQNDGRLWFHTDGSGGKPAAVPRTLCFDLSGAWLAPGFTASDLPFGGGSGCDIGILHTRDHQLTGGLLAMDPGTSMLAGGKFLWVMEGYNWSLVFDEGVRSECAGTFTDDSGAHEGNAQGEGLLITRPSTTTWTVEPNPEVDADGGLSAELHRLATKGKAVRECVARWDDFPFRVTLEDLGASS